MFLLFDISTNGRPRNWKAHWTETFSWPRIIHLSWLLYDKKGDLQQEGDHVIDPGTIELDQSSLKLAGLELETLRSSGTDIKAILEMFCPVVEKTHYAFAFNMQYHENSLLAELYRNNLNHAFMQTERICLMRESTYFCKIPSKTGGYKWPTLSELHFVLFKAGYEGAGNAQKDVMALSRCFNRLLNDGHLDDLF